MLNLLLAYLLTSFLVQQAQTYCLASALAPLKRPVNIWLIQAALVGLIYSFALVLSYRPYFSALITLTVAAIFLVVNQAKYKALAEPLVFSDIYLYLQVFTHPRLFLPFLNLPLAITATLIGLALLAIAIILEPPLQLARFSVSLILISLILVLLAFITQQATQIKLSFDPHTDIKQLGFFNSLIIYFIQARQKQHLSQLKQTIQAESPYTILTQEPITPVNLIIIQSESFFDPRPLSTAIKPSVLQHFDSLKRNAMQAGHVIVPAWGANTLRTEYAFLSGINNQKLKHYRFNPYQFLQTESLPSLVSYLKHKGYRCVCVHPNHSLFFKRNIVFPLLGFDEFIDIHAFDSQQTAGSYISDHAVTTKIQALLEETNDPRPLFIFAITMENHGPLHLESYSASDLAKVYCAEPPKQHHDLTVYLKHLKNADRMLLDLTSYLKTQASAAILCWYGDHIPSMPAVYQELNWQDGRSEYLLWSNYSSHSATTQQDLSIEQLGVELLNRAGLGITNKP